MPNLWAQDIPEIGETARYEGLPVARKVVEIPECPWCTDQVTSLVHDVTNLDEGSIFTVERLRMSLDALRVSRRFETVGVRVEPTAGGVEVVFSVKPGVVVRDIKVDGEYPLFTSDVLKAMSLSVGDTVMPGDMEEQERLVAELYRREGYAEPKVTAGTASEEGGSAIVTVSIEPGRYYSLETIRIRGNRAITDAEILSRMSAWRQSLFVRESGRFRQDDLTRDIENLKALYRQRGYAECTIKPEIVRNEKDLTVRAVLRITEGPRYRLVISGNRHFWTRTLMQDVVLFTEGNLMNRGIRKSVRNIVEHYRQEGYLSARVDVVEKASPEGSRETRLVEFAISEGPRTLVDKVSFSGDTALPQEALRKAVKTGASSWFSRPVFDQDVLRKDVETLKALYFRKGFTGAAVDPEVAWSDDRTSVHVTFRIDEGVQTTVSSIEIVGLSSVPLARALAALSLKPSGPYVEALLKNDETTLAELVSSRGHPYVKVWAETAFSQDRTQASVIFRVEEGPLVTMGNIYYRGNFITRTSVIRRELGIETGETFSLKTMLAGQKRIRDMQAFESVQFRTMGLREGKDRVTLLIDMQETEPFYYQGGLGYVTDRGFYGHAKTGDRNLFGLNKHVWTAGEVSQIGFRTEIGLTQQRIFDAPIVQTSTLSYERKEEFNQIFGTSVWSAATAFFWRPSKGVSTSLGVRYEHRDQFLQDGSDEIPPGEEDAYQPRGILVVSPSASYDTRDSFVRPTRGTYSSYIVDVSRGYQSSLDNFLRHTVNVRLYHTPLPRLTVAWLGRYVYIDPYGSVSRIPEDQLAFLGGTMSVRGFDENMLRHDTNDNPVGGRLAFNTSLEARFELTSDWETSLFIDAGAVRKPIIVENAGSDGLRYSAGAAFRYLTPIGPIGVMYGHKLDRKDGESAGRFHISVGYTF